MKWRKLLAAAASLLARTPAWSCEPGYTRSQSSPHRDLRHVTWIGGDAQLAWDLEGARHAQRTRFDRRSVAEGCRQPFVVRRPCHGEPCRGAPACARHGLLHARVLVLGAARRARGNSVPLPSGWPAPLSAAREASAISGAVDATIHLSSKPGRDQTCHRTIHLARRSRTPPRVYSGLHPQQSQQLSRSYTPLVLSSVSPTSPTYIRPLLLSMTTSRPCRRTICRRKPNIYTMIGCDLSLALRCRFHRPPPIHLNIIMNSQILEELPTTSLTIRLVRQTLLTRRLSENPYHL